VEAHIAVGGKPVGHRRRGAEMTAYRGRRAATIDNGTLRVTVLEEGGHIAEIRDLASGVNPLWTPDWPSIEPSTYDAAGDTTYGANAESSLLAGIMGHNLCLDVFGGPSAEEAAAGLPVHGEASVARFAMETSGQSIAMETVLPSAQLRVERRIALDGRTVLVRESVENLTSADRPVGWTEHVTIGPPFLENGVTELHVPADRSLVYQGDFGPAGYLKPGAEFAWPHAPGKDGGIVDLRRFPSAASSGCLHGAPARSAQPRSLLHRLLAHGRARVRLRLAEGRFPVARTLGRELFAAWRAVERPDENMGPGVRRVAHPGIAARHDRARPDVRDAGVPMDPRPAARRGELSRDPAPGLGLAAVDRMIESTQNT